MTSSEMWGCTSMKKTSVMFSLALLVVLMPIAMQGQATAFSRTLQLQSLPFAWPKTETEAARIVKPQILELCRELDDGRGNQWGTFNPGTDFIESYTFAKLDGKSMYLIALPDSSGRELYYDMEVIQCASLTCSVNFVDSDPPHNLA